MTIGKGEIIKYEYAASAKETEIEIEKEGQRDRATETDSDVIEGARPGLINYVYYIRRSAYGGKKNCTRVFPGNFSLHSLAFFSPEPISVRRRDVAPCPQQQQSQPQREQHYLAAASVSLKCSENVRQQ